MRSLVRLAVCVGALWTLNAVAVDFLLGNELRKVEETTRKRAEQAVGTPAQPAPLPDADEPDLLPRAMLPQPDRAIAAPAPALLPGRITPEPTHRAVVITPSAPKSDSASSQRERASAYLNEPAAPAPEVDGDAGWLGPPATTSPDAGGNLGRARAYSQGRMPASREASERSNSMTGSVSGNDIDLSHMGRDGIPVVPCYTSGNVAGRIGDDSFSGQIVQIVRMGRQISVRCK